MDVKEPNTEDLEIKDGEKDQESEIKSDETNVNDTINNEITDEEIKSDTTEVNCKDEGVGKESSVPVFGRDKKTCGTEVIDEKQEQYDEKQESETSNLEARKPESELISLQEKSEETEVKTDLMKTKMDEKEIQTDAIELEGKEIQTDALETEGKETQTEALPKEVQAESYPTKMDAIMQELLQQIECPVCFEYMVPPITLCSNGHNICRTCKPSLLQCPTCRGNLSAVKSNTAETLSKSITHPCKFRKSGCTGQFLVNFKETHEGECRYGPHTCPYKIVDKCHWEGPMSDMKQHIQNTHTSVRYNQAGKQTSYNGEYITFINDGCWHQAIFTLDKLFFSYSKIINNLLHKCYMYVGSREDTNNYKYTISKKSTDGNQSAMLSSVCPNYLDFIHGNFPNEKCVTFYVEFTKLCVNEEGELPFEYEILQY